MTLIAMTQIDAEALFRTPNERICVTTPEETIRRGPAEAAGNQRPPAGRPQSENPRSIPPGSERRCRRACASWHGSLPAPTCGGRHPGPHPLRRRTQGLKAEQLSELEQRPQAAVRHCIGARYPNLRPSALPACPRQHPGVPARTERLLPVLQRAQAPPGLGLPNPGRGIPREPECCRRGL